MWLESVVSKIIVYMGAKVWGILACDFGFTGVHLGFTWTTTPLWGPAVIFGHGLKLSEKWGFRIDGDFL